MSNNIVRKYLSPMLDFSDRFDGNKTINSTVALTRKNVVYQINKKQWTIV